MRHEARKKIKGLAFQSWLYISLFSVLILAMIWLLQMVFLNTFYQGMKLREVVTVGERITEAYGSDRFEPMVQELSFRDGLMTMLMDEEGGSVAFGLVSGRPDWRRMGADFDRLKQSLETSGTNAVHFTGGEGNRRFVVYMSRLARQEGGAQYLLIISVLPPIDSTVKVLAFQLRVISGIVIILSLLAALWFARRLSVPIVELTRSARKLAEGDLSVQFSGAGYNEISELADTLNYATAEISKSERYRNELVANVSHDLRTPLTLIKFYGEMIRDVTGGDETKRAEACDTIIKEADWLTEMVNEMLELSKLQQSQDGGDAEKTRFDISACLAGIIETVRVMVERDGYALELDIDEGVCVNGNEQGLKRAMYNLIGNALNYTGEDRRVRVSLKQTGGGARFEVSDTGAGVADSEAEKVWDRYYKSGDAHKRSVIGTGIGLSIVKAVLEKHGAEYGVKNAPGGGAVFWFVV